ncbi:MAG: prolipoprotein diacylglyceryl transferase [Desulfobacteraceae bacterium]|jgi:hypothetical protein
MANLIFVSVLGLLLGGLYFFGFQRFTGERWQFIGAIPLGKEEDGRWRGLNLTYYGLFNANACTLSVLIVYMLMSAGGLSLTASNLIIASVMGVCIPAAKLMARWVEKKAHTFSIGGAAFVGMVAAPPLMVMLNAIGPLWNMPPFPVMPPLAAIAIGYAVGEGIGRLACLSFGCCYGKPLDRLPPLLRRWMAPFCITYHGGTKKIAYADALQGCRVVAVPAITTVLYTLAGLLGILVYLNGKSAAAYLLCVVITQLWRFVSEFLRTDYRGTGQISAYQKMALGAVVYAVAVSIWAPAVHTSADIMVGLRLLWNPGIIISCQIFWIGIFLYMGRSQVTGAYITFHVHKDRI